ncbi:MAG TPA: hypothetical protein VF620_00830 [Allosphingosinicella sp.]|jgi:hypothetical protein
MDLPAQDVAASSISIGGWLISSDGSGNLNFTSPQGSVFQMSQGGSLTLAGNIGGVQSIAAASVSAGTVTATGAVTGGSLTAPYATVSGNPVVTAGMSIYLLKPIDGTVLNASTYGGAFGKGWKSTPYWRQPKVDEDSHLQIGVYVKGQWPFAPS